jgi:hypothetical protein
MHKGKSVRDIKGPEGNNEDVISYLSRMKQQAIYPERNTAQRIRNHFIRENPNGGFDLRARNLSLGYLTIDAFLCEEDADAYLSGANLTVWRENTRIKLLNLAEDAMYQALEDVSVLQLVRPDVEPFGCSYKQVEYAFESMIDYINSKKNDEEILIPKGPRDELGEEDRVVKFVKASVARKIWASVSKKGKFESKLSAP